MNKDQVEDKEALESELTILKQLVRNFQVLSKNDFRIIPILSNYLKYTNSRTISTWSLSTSQSIKNILIFFFKNV